MCPAAGPAKNPDKHTSALFRKKNTQARALRPWRGNGDTIGDRGDTKRQKIGRQCPHYPLRFTQYGARPPHMELRKPEFRTSGHRTSPEGASQYRLHCGTRPGEPRPAVNRQQPEKQDPLMQPRKQEHEGFYELLVYKRLWLLVREGGFEPPYLGCWILSPRCLLTISHSCIIHAPKRMVQPFPLPSSITPPSLFFLLWFKFLKKLQGSTRQLCQMCPRAHFRFLSF